MTHYYISADNEKGFEEVTEAEWLSLIGDENQRGYANKVYRGEMTLDEVPEEYRTSVQAIVANKVARWGEYEQRAVTAEELKQLIDGVM